MRSNSISFDLDRFWVWISSGGAVTLPSKLVVISLNVFLCLTTQRDSHSLPSEDNSPTSHITTSTSFTHTHKHTSLKIQKDEMYPGRTALPVVTQNVLTPPSTFSSLTSAIHAALDLVFNL
ncbi:hypothetical protein E2C01_015839 [Portunus trituberculatus]|uniref:Uncharacterized protein n=1 Tax=Portunus trituberculatus TaxID=210409 RepID=A0A5B7DMI2_PORTR|nr:hypothetical protein [Portunus trituberculatus]